MKKKNATFYIDEEILKQAKREIPNLSVFVESCFKKYLNLYGSSKTENMVREIQEELENIKKSQLNIHLLSEVGIVNEEIKEVDNRKLNKSWISIWANYRNTETIIDSDIFNASEVLGKSYSELVDMMEDLMTCLSKQDLAKCDDWNIALKVYNSLNG